jgi:hypothetical protein
MFAYSPLAVASEFFFQIQKEAAAELETPQD